MPPIDGKLPTVDPVTGKIAPIANAGANGDGAGAPAPGAEEETTPPKNGEEGGAGTGDGGTAGGEGGGTEVAELSIDDIQKTKDGYTWKIDPSDPKSMVYKGKDLNELFRNAAASIKEKDAYIEKLNAARPKLRVPSDVRAIEEGNLEEVEFPQFGQVLVAEAQRQGVTDIAMLSYGDSDLDKYAEEHSDRAARRMEDRINQIKAQANATFQKENTVALNNFALREETVGVQELLDQAGIAADDPEFDYDSILQKVFSDPKAALPNRVLKQGRIVAEAAKVINALSVKRAKASGKQLTEEEIAAARENKTKQLKDKGVPAGGPGGKRADRQAQPPAKTMAEALRRAKEQFLH